MNSLMRAVYSFLEGQAFMRRCDSDEEHAQLFWCAAHDIDPLNMLSLDPFRLSTPLDHRVCQNRARHYGNPRGPGWTPLHEACYLAKPKAVAAIARLRPDWVGSLDGSGCTPLRAIFLFNDTSPGWKHAGAYLPGAMLAPLGDDAAMRACAKILLDLGARLRGGELCAAAYLGKNLCCELLACQPGAIHDAPDDCFPEWAYTQELFARPVDGLSKLIACALHGLTPPVAAQLALAAPVQQEEAIMRAFVRTRQFDLAADFLGKRPWTAQPALLELARTSPRDLDEARSRRRVELAISAIARSPEAASKLVGHHRGAPCGIGALCALHGSYDLLNELLALSPLSPDEAAIQLEQARKLGTPDCLSGIAFAELERLALHGTEVRNPVLNPGHKIRL